jgi:hypothetical protein
MVAAVVAVSVMLPIPLASSAEWTDWLVSTDEWQVAAGYKQNDGGSLIVTCDTQTKLISIRFEEPLAEWEKGTTVDVSIKSDDGTVLPPSLGLVTAPTRLILENQHPFDLATMVGAKRFFTVIVGSRARTFPILNFQRVVGKVLRACGE